MNQSNGTHKFVFCNHHLFSHSAVRTERLADAFDLRTAATRLILAAALWAWGRLSINENKGLCLEAKGGR